MAKFKNKHFLYKNEDVIEEYIYLLKQHVQLIIIKKVKLFRFKKSLTLIHHQY